MNKKDFLSSEPFCKLEEVKGSPEELTQKYEQEEQTKFICDIISSIMQYVTDNEADEEQLLDHLRFIGCNDQVIDHIIYIVCNSKGYVETL